MNTNELEKALDELYKQVYLVLRNIAFYEELYMDQSSVEILNNKAPKAFAIIQASLANDIMASIFRLLDPIESYGNRNLTLIMLRKPLETKSASTSGIDKLENIKKNIINYRHKFLSHNDLERVITHQNNTQINFPWSAIKEFSDVASQLIIHSKKSLFNSDSKLEIKTNIGHQLLEVLKKAKR